MSAPLYSIAWRGTEPPGAPKAVRLYACPPVGGSVLVPAAPSFPTPTRYGPPEPGEPADRRIRCRVLDAMLVGYRDEAEAQAERKELIAGHLLLAPEGRAS